MISDVRIGDNFLKGDHVDGEVLQHTDLNELENVVKTAINANYEDIWKLRLGEYTAGSASGLEANEGIAILSQYQEEALQASDSKVPSSLQVKTYVDNLFNTVNVGLIYFWDGTSGQDSAEVFNTVCRKYDNGEKFVFFGRGEMDTGYYDPETGEWVQRSNNAIMPIMVSKRPQPYPEADPNIDNFSFTMPPYFFGDGYALCGIGLTGTWGNFTDVHAISWGRSMSPVTRMEVEEVAASPLNVVGVTTIDISTDPHPESTIWFYNENDCRTLFNALFGVETGRTLSLNLPIKLVSGGTAEKYYFIGAVTRSEFTGTNNDNFYGAVDLISVGNKTKSYKATIEIHFTETNPEFSVWTYVLNDCKLYLTEVGETPISGS